MVLVSCLRSAQELPNLCTVVVSSLWNQYPPRQKSHDNSWDDARRLEFHTFAQAVLSYLNMSPAVVYTSLKYVQKYLSSLPPSTRKTLMHGSERPIFMVALMLAYKFVEDCGSVDANYWSRASMIPVSALVKMEIDFLCQVSHKLHVDKSAFVRWVNQCNTTFEQQFYYFYTYATGVYPDNSFCYYPPMQQQQQQQYPCYVQPTSTYWYNNSSNNHYQQYIPQQQHQQLQHLEQQQQQPPPQYSQDYRWEQSSTPDSIHSNSTTSSASTLIAAYGYPDGDTTTNNKKYRMPTSSQQLCYYATDYPRDHWTTAVPPVSHALMQ
ncbi:hypothetical protein BDB00DRAFT_49560 [Zychaea mexicana]|uniref:uncharacterized protein n=1 Tax=Zychaea mexicana TaxID=64656 RepID=UPI0022FEE411|nr:uncharacterized protein BDB00DRAFT_49560 [Zychaea mexicana]KAI9497004.1 hypothetical protein BDB00DRAFT_49560 [Zychaea mexicana]